MLKLDRFSEIWDDQYQQIAKSWRNHWQSLNTLFNYPEDIRKTIYTTNAIESLNSVIRKAIKKRKIFPSDDSAQKMVYLAIKDASKKWTMPIQNWRQAMSRFIIEFEKRLENHINSMAVTQNLLQGQKTLKALINLGSNPHSPLSPKTLGANAHLAFYPKATELKIEWDNIDAIIAFMAEDMYNNF